MELMGCGRDDDRNEHERQHDNCICETVRAIKRIQGNQRELDCDDC